ncbi:MAG TPA: MFS transporter [Gammaproteobacteria bacterium]|nr:MFS transporter [Gammaproteobacteria bacterium]
MNRRAAWHWAFYDWANSAFATSIMAGFFPVFLKQYWSSGSDAALSTFRLGNANGIAALVIVVLAPVLGAIADRRGGNKGFVGAFAILGALASAGLFFVGSGDWPAAIVLYVLGVVGLAGGNVFYNAMLVHVAPPERWDVVSARGFALGYLGGGLLFALNVAMALKPHWFGLADSQAAVRMTFLTVGAWWLLFALPLLLGVRESSASSVPWRRAVGDGLRELRATFRRVRRLRPVWLFLLAYWLYIDGANTITAMAVDYGLSVGLDSSDLIVALLVTQFVSFPAAIAFGRIGVAIGARRGLAIAIGIFIAATFWAMFMRTAADFYTVAVMVGLVQGGLQSLSRSYYARLIPAGRTAEFFGFYGIVGKMSAVVGPFLVGWISLLTHNPRLAVGAVIVLFAGGGILLFAAPVPRRVTQGLTLPY